MKGSKVKPGKKVESKMSVRTESTHLSEISHGELKQERKKEDWKFINEPEEEWPQWSVEFKPAEVKTRPPPKIIKHKKTDRPLTKKEEKKVQTSEVTKRVMMTRCRRPPLDKLSKVQNHLGNVYK